MLKIAFCFNIIIIIFLSACSTKKIDSAFVAPSKVDSPKVDIPKKQPVAYQLVSTKDSVKKYLKTLSDTQLIILATINRADKKFLKNFDSLVVPTDFTKAMAAYFPFPPEAPFLKDVKKIIFFSYPSQCFAAYENGILLRTGPTNMGRKTKPTPTGLFYTNWKAKESTSTFNDEWNLKWNFNIENKLGVGFHQYALPGYPASHSCLRLLEKDAMYLYQWADQWKLEGMHTIKTYGTPVIVFGAYPFGSSKPWLALTQNGNALDITETDLKNTTDTFLQDIMSKQLMRDSLQ